MADASASKNPKGMNTKKDKEDMTPKITFFSKLKRVGDTNVGTMDMIQLRDRLKGGQSSMAKKISKCGIVQGSVQYTPTEGHDSGVDGSNGQILSRQSGCLPRFTKAELVAQRQEGSHQVIEAHQVRLQIRVW